MELRQVKDLIRKNGFFVTEGIMTLVDDCVVLAANDEDVKKYKASGNSAFNINGTKELEPSNNIVGIDAGLAHEMLSEYLL